MVNLDLIAESLDQFSRPTKTAFQSGTWGEMPPEDEITRALALVVAQRLSPLQIWTAAGNHSPAGNRATWHTSWLSPFFLQHSELDLAWTDQPNEAEPTVLIELKKRSSAAASQDHYAVLSDIAGLAADVLFAQENNRAVQGYFVFVGPEGERKRTPWLSCLLPNTEALEFRIQPSNALTKGQPDPRHAPYWCDRNTGLLHLDHRSGYNKVFGRSTSTKFIGVFRRTGVFSVGLDVQERITSNGFWCLLFRIVSVSLTGTQQAIQEWWP